MTGPEIFAVSLGAQAVGSVLVVRLAPVDDLNPINHARAVAQRQALTVAALLLILGGTNHVR
ncbi:hypothetical protein [Streptomyces lunaelactis]|uniref:hypothetical protein n=1 Tax=Streptomyces lunaelactis TaxID=1535768 RepID=UPI0015850A9A|nr:hypothetical protein [Streptomyces lunaelactis]NUK22028.1 hypothetical protein [Streptomyces lunaelactis]